MFEALTDSRGNGARLAPSVVPSTASPLVWGFRPLTRTGGARVGG